MKRILIIALALLPSLCFAQKASELKYVDARNLMVINQGFDNTELYYSRLPKDLKSVTRKDLWELGLNTAGVAIRFSTDSKAIGVKWTLVNNFKMNHMALTGIQGIDLYMLDENEHWHFIGTAIPGGKEKENMKILASDMEGKNHEYMAYLPLYDGVSEVEIGVVNGAHISKPQNDILTRGSQKPIVFYGTSITQGGCASRPGMIYSSMISRELQKECINLGFSGNARMDKSTLEAIKRIDAEQYVIDCLPNCTKKTLQDSAYFFLTDLAKAHPDAPIYMVENVYYSHHTVNRGVHKDLVEKNAYWKTVYERLRGEGYKNFRYIPADNLTGDGEGAVDGCHQTDLGFRIMADEFLRYLRR